MRQWKYGSQEQKIKSVLRCSNEKKNYRKQEVIKRFKKMKLGVWVFCLPFFSQHFEFASEWNALYA